ncbi:hypothetical protein FB451DRAFT_1175815 [Mycena latifolia]|nr:hypothetical protein FB451DRAFT_1175815 [Mycena latifolia]
MPRKEPPQGPISARALGSKSRLLQGLPDPRCRLAANPALAVPGELLPRLRDTLSDVIKALEMLEFGDLVEKLQTELVDKSKKGSLNVNSSVAKGKTATPSAGASAPKSASVKGKEKATIVLPGLSAAATPFDPDSSGAAVPMDMDVEDADVDADVDAEPLLQVERAEKWESCRDYPRLAFRRDAHCCGDAGAAHFYLSDSRAIDIDIIGVAPPPPMTDPGWRFWAPVEPAPGRLAIVAHVGDARAPRATSRDPDCRSSAGSDRRPHHPGPRFDDGDVVKADRKFNVE